MTLADLIDEVAQEDVELVDAMLGYDIYVCGEHAGSIEGVPGRLEYIVIEMHWEGKGAGRAALREFLDLSEEAGKTECTTNNAVHPAMEHILGTEGFVSEDDGGTWRRELSRNQ